MPEPKSKPAASDRPQTSSALIGAAILHLVPGVMYWAVAGFQGDRSDLVRVGGSVVLLALGILARWYPLPAANTATVLYLGYLVYLAFTGMVISPLTIIMHATILILLVLALVSALRSPAKRTSPET